MSLGQLPYICHVYTTLGILTVQAAPFSLTFSLRTRATSRRVTAITVCKFRRQGNVDMNLVASTYKSAAGHRQISAALVSPCCGWLHLVPLNRGSPAIQNSTMTLLGGTKKITIKLSAKNVKLRCKIAGICLTSVANSPRYVLPGRILCQMAPVTAK